MTDAHVHSAPFHISLSFQIQPAVRNYRNRLRGSPLSSLIPPQLFQAPGINPEWLIIINKESKLVTCFDKDMDLMCEDLILDQNLVTYHELPTMLPGSRTLEHRCNPSCSLCPLRTCDNLHRMCNTLTVGLIEGLDPSSHGSLVLVKRFPALYRSRLLQPFWLAISKVLQ